MVGIVLISPGSGLTGGGFDLAAVTRAAEEARDAREL
jgi:hypothetical protein